MKTIDGKYILSAMNKEELESMVVELNHPKFRAQQLHFWLFNKSVNDFDEMTNLSKDFRADLKKHSIISDTKIKQRLISKDGTIKYLLEFADGNAVETVLMRFDNRPNLTACVSSQVGCPVKCVFCATGQRGFIRNLSKREIVDQILTIQRDTGLKVTNIVYMGQGEPLLNYENVVDSIKFINENLEIGKRRITVSTSGIVPNIKRFADEHDQLTIALSLHAPTHELRKQLMPIENKYNLEQVIDSLHYFVNNTKRRVTIEYTLIAGINDSPEMAKKVNQLLKGLNCNINIIPYNPACDDQFKAPSLDSINMFRYILEQSGKKATVRLERGSDIMAACGQLSGQSLN